MLEDLINALKIIRDLKNDTSLISDNVLDKISEKSGVPKERILSRSREENVVFLRMALYYLYRERFGLSYPKIRDLTKRSDHTTIISGYNQMKDYLQAYANRIV